MNTSIGRLLIAFVLICGSVAKPQNPSSVDLTTQTGVANPKIGGAFEAGNFGGGFNYNIPIKVAPGRGGTEPKIALSYSSSQGNNWCGVGWNYEPGYIQRDSRMGAPFKLATTNYLDVYDDSCGFFLAGPTTGRLILTTSNSLVSTYRKETESGFANYTFFKGSSNCWLVTDQGGNKFYYGEVNNCRMKNPNTSTNGSDCDYTYRWAISKICDVNGNQINYSYCEDGGLLYLTNISYNENINYPYLPSSHRVVFAITNRSDTNINYSAGYRLTLAKRLAEIQTFAGTNGVSRYVLSYSNSPSTTRSLLASVTMYGSDFVTVLPPINFSYSRQQFAFGNDINWGSLYTRGSDGLELNSIRSVSFNTGSSSTMVENDNIDIDGDGLSDRIIKKASSPYTNFLAQRNTGSEFVPKTSNYKIGKLENGGNATDRIGSIRTFFSNLGFEYVGIHDLNADGLPDRVFIPNTSSSFTNWYVQTNTGYINSNCFSPAISWKLLSTGFYPSAGTNQTMVDMNGDGYPDLVLRGYPWRVDLGSSDGFYKTMFWGNIDSQGKNVSVWGGISSFDNGGKPGEVENALVMTLDINGDKLPDRVMRSASNQYTNFIVQYNTGTKFDDAEIWGGVNYQTNTSGRWTSPNGAFLINGTEQVTVTTMVDMNGDGLPDRVMRCKDAPYSKWFVQVNNGHGFEFPIAWTNVVAKNLPNNEGVNSITSRDSDPFSSTYGMTDVDLFDINGDGLPDRVVTGKNSPYTNYVVKLNMGPFPDLLSRIENGIGGVVEVSYSPSTKLDNRDRDWSTDPWNEGAKSLLPYNVWVVNSVVASDGLGTSYTNWYGYLGGYYNPAKREFNGFAQVVVTNQAGLITRTFFHQGGGRDGSSYGELDDVGSHKLGMPYRIDTILSNGVINSIVLNKVDEVIFKTNGCFFPFISQSINMNFAAGGYRAVAKQYGYDTNNGNVVFIANIGEVTNVSIVGQTYSDIGNDKLFKWISYTNIGDIQNRPSDTLITSDNSGTTRLQESRNVYDDKGNLLTSQTWLDSSSVFVNTVSNKYDQYGNIQASTDAAGITTTIVYDTINQQFPVSSTVGSFTTAATYDNRSGLVVTSTDMKGLISSNSYDVFFRPTASYTSTNSYGPPVLWKSKTFYSLDGISGGSSQNYVLSQVNDAVDPVNGYETYAYFDGLGRTIQTRSEAETGQYRVVDSIYDARGNPFFTTLSYFSSGIGYTAPSGTLLGSLTEYDSLGRVIRSTPAVNASFSAGKISSTTSTGGDAGSLVGVATTAFEDGSNPWAKVVTDANGKIRKSFHDAYGQTIQVVAITSDGNVTTTYGYDLIGNLTNVTDNVNNSTVMRYDSLGRKTSMTDPDMGFWYYWYDNAGRITKQTDARTNSIVFNYNDPLGRIVSKQIYNMANSLVGTVTYTYDTSDDGSYTVYPSQLYKVTDLQGSERFSYDVRGRTLKDARFLKINTMEYVTQSTYDDADRVKVLTYPGGIATIQYSYDTAGHISEVKSLSGTGTQETFYTPDSFNALDQLSGYANGNGVATTYAYYSNSKRLQNITTGKAGTNYQNLSYTFDGVSDITSVGDGVYSGSASAAISSVTYDDLYRITSLNSTARGLKNYAYNSLGNILTNQDNGSGLYQYGVKPHAAISANGVNYGYDAGGNMTTRGSQSLVFDEQNQLAKVIATNGAVAFGYDESGERLWRAGTNGYSVWIGGIYEINNGKVLCHVLAGGQLIATFEPECTAGLSRVFGEKNWFVASTAINSILDWPFQNGRGYWTIFGGTWVGIVALCWVAGRRYAPVTKHVRWKLLPVQWGSPGKTGRFTPRLADTFSPTGEKAGMRGRGFTVGPGPLNWMLGVGCWLLDVSDRFTFKLGYLTNLWRQAVTVTFISAFLLGSIGNADAAPAYNPVFYYYHPDPLGSSNILTDRAGNVVQHYEYATFGQTSYQNNTSAFPVSNRYTGQIADDETGLLYYGGRYYDPQLGRFIQPDPTVPDPTDSQSLNRYSYCRNNPLNSTDPTGFTDGSGGGFWSGVGSFFGYVGGAIGGFIGGAVGGIARGIGGVVSGIANSSMFSSSSWSTLFGSPPSSSTNKGINDSSGMGINSSTESPNGPEYKRGGSAFGNMLGGIWGLGYVLGPVGDVLSGTVNLFAGHFSRGLDQINFGVYDMVRSTGLDAYNLAMGMTFGKSVALSIAIQHLDYREFLASLIIPHWGESLGANWGYDRYGSMDNRNNTSWWTKLDYGSISHDDRSGYAKQLGLGHDFMGKTHQGWINDVNFGQGAEPGVSGQAIRLIGAPSFYIFSHLDPGFKK